MERKHATLKTKTFVGDLSDEELGIYLKDTEVSVDCEMMGLNPRRDRLCVIQFCDSRNNSSLVQILPGQKEAKNIQTLLENQNIVKIFHFARMDLSFLKARLGIATQNVFCTKIGSKLARTYTDKHGLKELVKEFFDENMDKTKQSSDWGVKVLKKDQITYASHDVKYLVAIKGILTEMLVREGRFELAKKAFETLPLIVDLDLLEVQNLFEH